MLTPAEKIGLIIAILITGCAFFIPVITKIRIIMAGQPEPRFSALGRRFFSTLTKVFLQRCTLKNERVWTGLMHVLIFYGALTFDTFIISLARLFLVNFSPFQWTSFPF